MKITDKRLTQMKLIAGSSTISEEQRSSLIAALGELHASTLPDRHEAKLAQRTQLEPSHMPSRRPARAPLENGGRTWGDPTGQTAVRNVTFERLGISEELLEDVEEILHANPGMGIRKMAKAMGIARLTAEAAVEALILADRVRVIGGLYV